MKKAILDLEEKYENENKNLNIKWRVTDKVVSKDVVRSMIKKLPLDMVLIVIAVGSFNARGLHTNVEDLGYDYLVNLVKNIDPKKCYFVIGHSMRGYEKAIIDICKESGKDFKIYAIIPKMISKETKERILNFGIDGLAIAIDNDSSGIYKSFNYEIFERVKSIVIAIDGNSPVLNLVQEAENGKWKAKIYVNSDVDGLKEKANSLEGYVKTFNKEKNLTEEILKDNPEII